jgi:hypothetical protein
MAAMATKAGLLRRGTADRASVVFDLIAAVPAEACIEVAREFHHRSRALTETEQETALQLWLMRKITIPWQLAAHQARALPRPVKGTALTANAFFAATTTARNATR